MNVLLISVDTCRSDVAYSGQFESFERLRREGTWFENAISTSPLTPVSHASVLTGLFPFHHGIRHLFREHLKNNVKTIAEIFKKAGFQTYGVVSCPGLNSWYGFAKGFDVYDDDIPFLPDGSDALRVVDVVKRGLAKRDAEIVLGHSINLINKSEKSNFFLFSHFFDTNLPYNPPAFTRDKYRNLYEAEVAYVDYNLSKLISFLETKNLLDDTLIVLFSDHGEDLAGLYENDKGGKEGLHPEENGHGSLLYDTTQLVPLIFRFPKAVPRGLRIREQVRLVDLMPTILQLAGLPVPKEIDGVELTPFFAHKGKSLVAYSETFYPEENAMNKQSPLKSIRIQNGTQTTKVIWEVKGDNFEVYDVSTDKNETRNLARR